MATLTFVTYCLSEHPDVLMKLREEILTKVGPTRRPTFDDLKDCKFLRAVINGMFISDDYGIVLDDVACDTQRHFVYIPLCMYHLPLTIWTFLTLRTSDRLMCGMCK